MRAATVAWIALSRVPRPILFLTVAGWVLLASSADVPAMPDLCLSVTNFGQQIAVRAEATFASADLVLAAGSWLAMLVAMMPPLLSAPLLHLWRQSLSRRRWRAIGLFLCAYMFVWIAAGALLMSTAILIQVLLFATGVDPIVAAAFIALSWQATPWKQLSLNRCHRRPTLAAFGFKAVRDDLMFGFVRAFWCVGTCWAFMLCALLSSGLLQWGVMAAAMSVSLFERTREPRQPSWFSALGLSLSIPRGHQPVSRGAS
ncbi:MULTISPECIES: DUF2182 domain-containing protein [unclassified Mesorhizobium]|uniref:copper chaperone n=1 Tax=unclassified Mesorhizobium TaxID=325217 RepID=UPI000FE82F07|nr:MULTISPECIES: DUF2182 domain-containing protein [unclassified Mesorhizobium]RWB93097.1 MAG: DUF2182 domain-containing protein [Mesorhizobium sp.]TGV18301.1 DUF2182 domain-containing protein [Mesorhizobium sp. M4B.F.Ca.ET.143.01.1.1]